MYGANMENNQIELEGNQYYKIICLLTEEKDDAKWLAHIRVKRIDTDEYVKAGFTIFDNDKNVVMDKVMSKIDNSLLIELDKLGKPLDWNSDIRNVLLFCKKLHTKIIEFSSYTTDTLSINHDADNYLIDYASFWKMIIKESFELGRKIELLTEEERINLLTLPKESLSEPSDSWNLEQLDMRLMVFDFFINPTDIEIETHNIQKIKLKSRFEELGWD